MFAAGKTAAVSGAGPDAQFNYVTMLLHGDGTNGAQNNTFLDSSTNNFTITRNGNTTQGSFSPYGSNWSNFFDGNGDYLSLASNAAFTVGTGDVTIEAWIYVNSLSTSSYQGIMSGRLQNAGTDYPGLGLVIDNNKLAFTIFTDTQKTIDTTNVTLNEWIHVVGVRSGTNMALFVNGVRKASRTNSENGTSSAMNLGRFYPADDAYYFDGYISNARIVKGTAVYNPTLTTLTVPTSPLTAISGTSLLTCQSNRFVDNSTNNFAITINGTPSVQRFNPFGTSTAYSTGVIGGSGYFDGSGDYLATSSTQIIPATTTYTVEAWVYLTGDYSDYREIVTQGSSGNANRWLMYVNITDGKLGIQTGASGITTSFTVPKNTWTHLAFVNNSGSYTVYANGVSVGSGTNTVTPQNTYLTVGAFQSGAEYFQGYISNVRITNTAVYTSAFTPNTAPLTAISGTSLLLSTINGAIFDNAMMNNLETVGNAQISTSVVKYGTGSLAFDGTGDYLVSNPATTNLYAFGTGDFTIEFWVYINNVSGTQVIYDCRPASGEGLYPTIYTSGGVLAYYTNSDNRITGSSLSANTWYHIAVSRSGSSTKMFVNGTQTGSTYTDSNNYINTAGRPFIGGNANTVGSNSLNGYIDDLRITKGYARYTATFTPPTAALPDIGPI